MEYRVYLVEPTADDPHLSGISKEGTLEECKEYVRRQCSACLESPEFLENDVVRYWSENQYNGRGDNHYYYEVAPVSMKLPWE